MFYQIVISILIVFICALFAKAAPLEDHVEKNKVKNVELQWSLCESSSDDVLRKASVQDAQTTSLDTYYYETRAMDLLSHKSFVRVRATAGSLKSTAKVNYADDRNLPWDDLKNQDGKCEWDQYPGYQKVGCSLNAEPNDFDKVLSKDQQAFLKTNAGFADFQNLVKLGPAHSVVNTWHLKHLSADLVLEAMTAPGGFSSLEISTRVPLDEGDETRAQVEQWLKKYDIRLCPTQRGKSAALIRTLLNP